jgi:hypothetical protein
MAGHKLTREKKFISKEFYSANKPTPSTVNQDYKTGGTEEKRSHTFRATCAGLLCSPAVMSTGSSSYSAQISSKHTRIRATFVDNTAPYTFIGIASLMVRDTELWIAGCTSKVPTLALYKYAQVEEEAYVERRPEERVLTEWLEGEALQEAGDAAAEPALDLGAVVLIHLDGEHDDAGDC